jgi:hypothetical protein
VLIALSVSVLIRKNESESLKDMTICVALIKRLTSILGLATLSASIGCGGIEEYMVDPAGASSAAIEQYDKNDDALLDETELKACPALLRELRAYDESKDGKLSAEEIGAQIKEMYGRAGGMMSLDCTVNLDGGPLAGATVKFIPESFLGQEIKAAQGVTNNSGIAAISLPPEEMPKPLRRQSMMRVGIYRVEITHPTKKIPAKYNTETELGFEFHRTNHIQPPVFNLISKGNKA